MLTTATLASLAVRIGPVPRYTSYPTAPHFQPTDGDAEWRSWLSALPASSRFALYVHVPFCRQMCWYCGCNTQVLKGDRQLDSFIDLLLREIDLLAPHLPSGAKLSGLHFGGGTPSILGSTGLQRVAEKLYRQFERLPGAEIAIELDPRHLDAALLPGLQALGVNRASLGVQSLDETVQVAINRRQPLDMVYRAAALLRDAGIPALNLDLIYGLPGQTVDNVIETVRASLALQPDRIALFGYAHVPWMKPHQQRIDAAALPDTAARFAQEAAAAEVLTDAGYRRIGLDHFAHPQDTLSQLEANGALQRNFQGYTAQDGDVLLGIGPSAISTLPQGYAQNTPAVASWREAVAGGQLPVAKLRAVTAEDRLRRAVISELMCHLQVNLAELAIRHGMTPAVFDADFPRLALLEDSGVVSRQGYRLQVAEAGRPLVRQVCAAFDQYLQPHVVDSTPRHAAA
ncbi:MAG: oxygen-independent coproporphyrinogen III oxidase [Ferrovibrio sp.]